LSQENLAVDAGVDRTYVSRLERGLENPTVGILDQLADAGYRVRRLEDGFPEWKMAGLPVS
jgi:transcriptional regulator with XRE-family HTH domain